MLTDFCGICACTGCAIWPSFARKRARRPRPNTSTCAQYICCAGRRKRAPLRSRTCLLRPQRTPCPCGEHCIWRIFPGIIHIFFRHQRKKNEKKKTSPNQKKMKQSWQPKCTSSSPHLLCFSHPQLELASVSPSLSLTLFVFLSLSLSLPLSPLCYSLSFLSSLCFCLTLCPSLSLSLSLSLPPPRGP